MRLSYNAFLIHSSCVGLNDTPSNQTLKFYVAYLGDNSGFLPRSFHYVEITR